MDSLCSLILLPLPPRYWDYKPHLPKCGYLKGWKILAVLFKRKDRDISKQELTKGYSYYKSTVKTIDNKK